MIPRPDASAHGAGLRHASGRRPLGRNVASESPPPDRLDRIPADVFQMPGLDRGASAPRPDSRTSSIDEPVKHVLDMMALITLPSMLAAVGAQSAIDVYDVTLSEPGQLTPEITTNDLRRALESGGQLVVDARTAFEFALGHIPTAVNPAPKPGVPMSQYVSDASEIGRLVGHDRNSAIIIYCNGPFCGKSRRLGEELVRQGFTNVRRYQLGASMWRTLVGPMEIEPAGISYVLRNDRTAVCIDARTADEYAEGTVAGARNVSVGELIQAKDDGRLPMDDFNTRVVVCGRDRAQALQMARALVGQGFGNVKYYADTFSRLIGALR